MKKRMQALFKDERGVTLVELLAVIVILGIIGAIAVPSIAGIIDNSKKDAHLANTEQLVSAARMAMAVNEKDILALNAPEPPNRIMMEELVSKGYLESNLKDPDDTRGKPTYELAWVDLVESNGHITYKVYLESETRYIGAADDTAINASGLTRDNIKKNWAQNN